jgi:hypothetical protein
MSNTLHILNGDATLYGFEQTGLDGDVLIWREVFSEGPLSGNVGSAEFWSARSAFICSTFNDTPERYQQWVVNELEKLNKPYTEINLWFEFDLHCQVNMLGVMMLLQRHVDLSAPAVNLICPAEYPGVDDFRGMGQLNAEQLETLYDARVNLNEWEFTLAGQAWKLLASENTAALTNWLSEVPFWGNLHLLKPALEAHIKRTALDNNGLNIIEQRLLSIYNSGLNQRTDIYEAFWKNEKIYGMGDAELDIYLRELGKKQLIHLQ